MTHGLTIPVTTQDRTRGAVFRGARKNSTLESNARSPRSLLIASPLALLLFSCGAPGEPTGTMTTANASPSGSGTTEKPITTPEVRRGHGDPGSDHPQSDHPRSDYPRSDHPDRDNPDRDDPPSIESSRDSMTHVPPSQQRAQVRISKIGESVSGRPIEVRSVGNPDLPAVLYLSTIHGDEWAGTPLLQKLESHLLRRPELLRTHHAVMIPVLNPDGYAADRRTNDHGVDLNRNFPADNFQSSANHGMAPLSEPESTALHGLIESLSPERIISMHQPYGVLDFDGPAEGLAYLMAAVCDLPVKRVGSRPGSLGSWVGLEKKLPIITVEFHRGDHRLGAEELWSRYGAMLLVCLRDNIP